jgi:hypothetical protein
LGGRGRWISKFEASLVYKVSSRTARAKETLSPKRRKKKKEGNITVKTRIKSLSLFCHLD